MFYREKYESLGGVVDWPDKSDWREIWRHREWPSTFNKWRIVIEMHYKVIIPADNEHPLPRRR